MVSTLVAGLRASSRINEVMSDVKVSQDTLLLGAIVDRLSTLCSILTGNKQAESVVDKLLGIDSDNNEDVVVFGDVHEFNQVRYGG